MDFSDEEECDDSSDDILADECLTVVDWEAFEPGFGSKAGKNDKDGNPVITIIDRSGAHEIGVRWCCCLNAPGRDIVLPRLGSEPARRAEAGRFATRLTGPILGKVAVPMTVDST